MNTTESTKAFLPLSIENDTHFNCTETFTPSISWQYTDKTDKAPTQWTVHSREEIKPTLCKCASKKLK